MFSTVRPCVRVRACECRFVCPRRNQDFKTTKHPPVPHPSEDLSSVGINILIMHVLSSVGVFQIRSTHSHNNSIYAATAEYYIKYPTCASYPYYWYLYTYYIIYFKRISSFIVYHIN